MFYARKNKIGAELSLFELSCPLDVSPKGIHMFELWKGKRSGTAGCTARRQNGVFVGE